MIECPFCNSINLKPTKQLGLLWCSDCGLGAIPDTEEGFYVPRKRAVEEDEIGIRVEIK